MHAHVRLEHGRENVRTILVNAMNVVAMFDICWSATTTKNTAKQRACSTYRRSHPLVGAQRDDCSNGDGDGDDDDVIADDDVDDLHSIHQYVWVQIQHRHRRRMVHIINTNRERVHRISGHKRA